MKECTVRQAVPAFANKLLDLHSHAVLLTVSSAFSRNCHDCGCCRQKLSQLSDYVIHDMPIHLAYMLP